MRKIFFLDFIFCLLIFNSFANSDTSNEEISSLKFLPKGTNGTYGIEGTYVEFGIWPQTIKSDDVTISSETKNINGFICYEGNDNRYYVKIKAEPYKNDYQFSNGKNIKKDTDYYFKLEPIKWRVITNDYQGKKLLLSEKILINDYYYLNKDEKRIMDGKTIYPNNYKYSSIRAYLNGLNGSDYNVRDFTGTGFIDKAFTKEDIKKIYTSIVDNSVESASDSGNNIKQVYKYDCECENTEDKIFLLSEKEITKYSYGFDSYDEHNIKSTRIRKNTDYSLAMGIYSNKSSDYKNNCWWWLRSPIYDNYGRVHRVYYNGNANNYSYVYRSYSGIVPALLLN